MRKKEFCRHPSCQRAHIVWLQECGAFRLMASNNLMFSFRANKPKQGTNSWWSIYFLAATKQLLEQFSLYVSPSACDTFVTMFLSSHHFEIFSSYYHWQKWYPYKSSMSEVKGQGHRGENKFCPNLGVSIPYLHFEFTDSHEIMHKASSSMGEKPYYFSRLSINFQSHRGQKNINFDPNWVFLDCNSSLISPAAVKWCAKLEVANKRCPVVFHGHPSSFKVTWNKNIASFYPINQSINQIQFC